MLLFFSEHHTKTGPPITFVSKNLIRRHSLHLCFYIQSKGNKIHNYLLSLVHKHFFVLVFVIHVVDILINKYSNKQYVRNLIQAHLFFAIRNCSPENSSRCSPHENRNSSNFRFEKSDLKASVTSILLYTIER